MRRISHREVRYEDAYYKSIKELLRFALITGLFPISRNSQGTYEFRWISARMLWSIFVFLATSSAVVYSTYVKIENFQTPNLPFDEYLFTLIFICILIPHWFFQIVSVLSSTGVAEYLTMWNDLESFGTTMGVLSPLAQMFMLGSFTTVETIGFYHILSTISFFCVWSALQCSAFSCIARGLRRSMLHEYHSRPNQLKIRNYRELWQHVQTMTEKMSDSMRYIHGCYIGLLYLPNMVTMYCLLSQLFNFTRNVTTARFIGYCVCMLHFILHVYGVFNAGYFLEIEVTDAVRRDLSKIRLHELSPENVIEVRLFLNTIDLNKVNLTTNDGSKIDRCTFGNYVASMAMYCLILLQIKVTLPQPGNTG